MFKKEIQGIFKFPILLMYIPILLATGVSILSYNQSKFNQSKQTSKNDELCHFLIGDRSPAQLYSQAASADYPSTCFPSTRLFTFLQGFDLLVLESENLQISPKQKR